GRVKPDGGRVTLGNRQDRAPISGTGMRKVSVSSMSDTPASRLTRDAKRLVSLGQALSRSGSRLEDIYWEDQLAQLITKMLGGKKSKTLENVLDFLLADDINVYEILVEQAETCSESLVISRGSADQDRKSTRLNSSHVKI